MCAAPAGNQFWKLRSKHGRDTLFGSSELMWEAACEYFEWCENNSLMEVDFRGKDANEVEIPKMRAFTMQGLCRYLDCDTSYFRKFKETASKDFFTVITRIEEAIYEQKFTGAAAGFLNANIISRDLGLIDKKDLHVDTDITVEFTGDDDETES
jgi:hypothetical protein